MKLKSRSRVKRAFMIITKEVYTEKPNSLITKIDKYIESIVFCLSASNWRQVYTYASSRVKALKHEHGFHQGMEAAPTSLANSPSQAGHDSVLYKLDVIALQYLDSHRLQEVLTDFMSWCPNTHKPIHRHIMEYFIQHSMIYWIQCHPETVARESENPSGELRAQSTRLFDYLFKSSTENRTFVSWAFLSMLSLLIPDGFQIAVAGYNESDGEAIKSPRFQFLELLHNMSSDMMVIAPQSSSVSVGSVTSQRTLGICATCYSIFALAASNIMQIHEHVFSQLPIVEYATLIYPSLLNILFNQMDSIPSFAKIDYLQSRFISSYLVLRPGDAMKDLIGNLPNPSFALRSKRNIIVGLRSMQSRAEGGEILNMVMNLYNYEFIAFCELIATKLQEFEEISDYGSEFSLHVEALKYALDILLTHSQHAFDQVPESFSTAIIKCSTSKNELLRTSVTQVLLSFVKRQTGQSEGDRIDNEIKERVSLDETGHILFPIYDGISMNIRSSVEAIISMPLTSKQLEKELMKVHELLTSRDSINNSYSFRDNVIEDPQNRLALGEGLETAMVLCLCSSNMDICKLAMANIRLMVQEAMLLEDFENVQESSWSIMLNFHVYSEISSQTSFYTPIAIQKKLCRLFQTVHTPSDALIRVWTVIHGRWSVLNAQMLSEPTRGSDFSSMSKEWRCYYGILSSLLIPLLNPEGGVKVKDNVHFKARQFLYDSVNFLVSDSAIVRETSREVLANDVGPLAYHHVLKQLSGMIDSHIMVVMDSQENGSHNESSAQDKPPLPPRPSSFIATKVNSLNTLLGQTSLLVRSIIEQLQQDDIYISVDIGALALKIVRYINTTNFDMEILKLVLRVCQLLETIGKTAESLNMKHDSRIRNELVMSVSEWFERAINFDCHNAVENKLVAEKCRLVREICVNTSKCLSELLNGLSIEVPDGVHERDMISAKFNTFNNLFSLFLRSLQRCKDDPPVIVPTVSDTVSVTSSTSAVNSVSSVPLPTPFRLLDKAPIIRENAIACLSKLLNANVEVGLRTALPLGYHEDETLRLAFLEIFRNILSKETKYTSDYSDNLRYEELVDFLVSNIRITLSLCDICPASEADEFSTAILGAFEFRGKGFSLVKAALTKEIEQTNFASDILRRNCVATKLLSLYSKSRGHQYLQSTLGSFVNNIASRPDLYAFEIDNNKLKNPDEEMKPNFVKYERCLNELFTALESSEALIPTSFREIASAISRAVSLKFPEYKESAVGSFFFLRFLCPVLVSPEQEGLLSAPPSRDIRRSFLLLAKAVQNISNCTSIAATHGSTSHDVDGFGGDTNDKKQRMQRFLSSLSSTDEDTEVISDDTSSQGSINPKMMDSDHLRVLHTFVYNHWDDAHHKILIEQRKRRLMRAQSPATNGATNGNGADISRLKGSFYDELTSSGQPPPPTSFAPTFGRRTHQRSQKFIPGNVSNGSNNHYRRSSSSSQNGALATAASASAIGIVGEVEIEANRRFSALVRSLGRPRTPKARKATAVESRSHINPGSRLNEFMARNEDRDLSTVIDQRVVHEGIALDGSPVMLVTYRNYDREKLDSELVLYRFFQVANRMWSDKFSLFYDCTSCTPSHLLSNTVRTIRDTMVPPEMAANCTTVYYYNVSTKFLPALKSFLRNYESGTYMNPVNTKYVFLTTADINTVCNVHGLNLDQRSVKVIDDARLIYQGGKMLSSDNNFYPVTVKVGNEYLQLHGERPFNYIRNSPGLCNDVYHLSEIREITHSRTTSRPEEFTIEMIDGEKVIVLHKKKNEIIRAIMNAKSRLPEEAREVNDSLVMNLEDGLGCFLNIGFSNLCSNNSALQEAAFNLLAMIPERFNISFGREIRGGKGFGIPKKEVSMSVVFSEVVASTHIELTYDFLLEFSKSFKSFSKEQGNNAILYAAPWVKNIYSAQREGGKDAASLIRIFLDIAVWSPDHYTSLLLNFWPALCLQEELTDILVDEVIRFAVERGSQDMEIEDVLAVLTSCPTLSICGTVITRCRKILNKPLPANERLLTNHPDWTELDVLIRLVGSLSFESLLIAEVYLPEIILLVSSLIYTGPYSFRNALCNLLVNVLHAFSCCDRISSDQRSHLISIWADLTSTKGKLLFGLNDDMKDISYDYFSLASISHIENFCLILMDIIASASPSIQKANVWRSRWSSLVINACFADNPSLQCRSFLVLGSLAKIEVEDAVVTQVLKVLYDSLTSTKNQMLNEEYCVCTLICLTKMMDGLSDQSAYHSRMFWLGVALLHSQNSNLFSHGLLLIEANLRTLDNLGAFKDISIAEFLLEGRQCFESQWGPIQELMDVRFSVEYFDLCLSAVVLKGMEKASTRVDSLQALETFLEISSKNSVKVQQSNKYASYLCYLYFLFLGCRSQSELKDLLWVAGYPDDHMNEELVNDNDLPALLEEYISQNSFDTTIALYLGGQLFRSSSEYDVSGLRFLGSLRFVGETNLAKKCMVYATVRSRLLKLTEFGSQKPMMKSILAAGTGMLVNYEEFRKLAQYRAQLEEMLEQSGFKPLPDHDENIVTSSSVSTFSQTNEIGSDMKSRLASLVKGIIVKDL
ncbi:Ras GTPase activating protein IRA2 [Sugiyamaella lignohabitans]|uniref:Ras GTPase activating protein IRA2 n=1 Tax=Sugiyamaella lignohabitans TaxID=796027 RepID=A0A170QY52_9ASCO|nr:Ras GTPase activating protein IRA2 [Sugiyamaella lignohabitans]ANB15965.1 Ras GTPase activating protein IRA2 [Sugiyamaella lignohabitans]